MKNIASALVKAQKQFGPALKTHTNPHFRSTYADLSACIEAVIDALNNNGIALMQQTRETESGVTVETVFVHESGETLSSGPLHVPASKQDPQGYGSALTYARRYSLMAACGIAPEDDDGNAASRAQTKKPQAAANAPKHRPTQDAVLTPEQQRQCEAAVQEIRGLMDRDDLIGAFEIYQQYTDSEERTFIWSQLSAPTRRAIKEHGEKIKEAA